MSSVRATEQFRSRRARPDRPPTGFATDLADGFAVWTLAVAGIYGRSLGAADGCRPFRRCARL